MSSLTDMELKSAIERPLIFPPYPCHSQHVERSVKEVTEASIKRCGHQGRHRFNSIFQGRFTSFQCKERLCYF